MFTWIVIFFPLGFKEVSSNYEYVHLGCYQDSGQGRALNEYFKNFPSKEAIQKCAGITASKGFLVFGVQYGGECYSSPDSELTYNKYGPASNCENGVGGSWSFDAYKFKICRNLLFDQFPESGKTLTNHTVEEDLVENIEVCRIRCFMNTDCVSFNLGPSANDGMMSCQLSNVDRYQYPFDYKNATGFTYQGSKNICNTNPCIDGATCKPGFGHDPYRCVCPAGHSEAHCKKPT